MSDTDVSRGVLSTLRDTVAEADAGRVFGTPIEQNGTIVLPVAKISGGGGGGGAPGRSPRARSRREAAAGSA